MTSQVTEEAVREHLATMFKAAQFAGSRRGRAFLRFVVENTLNGQVDILKERMIAIHLLGRKSDVDLSADTIVRVTARDVRRRLKAYYETAEGASAPMRIQLAAGAYVPRFVQADEAPPAGAGQRDEMLRWAARDEREKQSRCLALASCLFAAGVVAGGALCWAFRRRPA